SARANSRLPRGTFAVRHRLRFTEGNRSPHSGKTTRAVLLVRSRTRQRQCTRIRRTTEIAHTLRRTTRLENFRQVRRVRAALLRERRYPLLRLVRRELRQRTHPQLRRLVVHPIRRQHCRPVHSHQLLPQPRDQRRQIRIRRLLPVALARQRSACGLAYSFHYRRPSVGKDLASRSLSTAPLPPLASRQNSRASSAPPATTPASTSSVSPSGTQATAPTRQRRDQSRKPLSCALPHAFSFRPQQDRETYEMSLAFLAFRLLVLQSENRPGAVCNLRVAPNACPFTLSGYLKGRSAVSKPLELSTTLSRPPGRCTGTARSGNLCAYRPSHRMPSAPAGAFFCLHHARRPSAR